MAEISTQKSFVVALILSLLVGSLGIDRFVTVHGYFNAGPFAGPIRRV